MLTQSRASELFSRIVDLHLAHDPARIEELFTVDAVYHDDSWPEPARGHEEIKRLLSSVWRAFPDFEVGLLEGPFVGDSVDTFAVRGAIRGTMDGPLDPPGLAPTGGVISAEYAGFYAFDGDLLRRGRIILNVSELAAQTGALPRAGSPAERLAVRFQRIRARRMRYQARSGRAAASASPRPS